MASTLRGVEIKLNNKYEVIRCGNNIGRIISRTRNSSSNFRTILCVRNKNCQERPRPVSRSNAGRFIESEFSHHSNQSYNRFSIIKKSRVVTRATDNDNQGTEIPRVLRTILEQKNAQKENIEASRLAAAAASVSKEELVKNVEKTSSTEATNSKSIASKAPDDSTSKVKGSKIPRVLRTILEQKDAQSEIVKAKDTEATAGLTTAQVLELASKAADKFEPQVKGKRQAGLQKKPVVTPRDISRYLGASAKTNTNASASSNSSASSKASESSKASANANANVNASKKQKTKAAAGKSRGVEQVLLAGDVPGFTLRRLGIFACILVGYSCYYLTRNSLTFTAPVLVADASLGLDITAIGLVTSIFPLCYGCSKFISGTLSDVLSPRLMLGGGLLMTGLVNCAFGASSSLTLFCGLWALNGLLQGFGAPSCAKILTAWFATKERGTYWGMWNIAHNLGGFGAPILAGTAAKTLGWRYGLFAPGAIAIVVGLILLVVCRASPEAAGYPPVELPENKALVSNQTEEEDEEELEPELSVKDNLIQNVLSNPYIWGLALTYFCVYIVRQGVTSWSVFYLMKEKAVQDVAQAATRVAGLELGGLCGSLIAGRLSDYMIAKNQNKGAVGQRIRVVMVYLVGVGLSLLAFKAVPASSPVLQAASVFMLGFFLYGPQMLIGLCGAEIVGRKSVGASEGFLGWVAYLGAANAGAPLSILVRKFGWSAFFTTLIGASVVGFCLLIPLMNAKSFVQREEAAYKLANA